jgi:hypothetical protein
MVIVRKRLFGLLHKPWHKLRGQRPLKIVEQLAEHSVLPSPGVIYDRIMIAELKKGPVGHQGVVLDPQLQRKYREWWDLGNI